VLRGAAVNGKPPAPEGAAVLLSIRPEQMRIARGSTGATGAAASVSDGRNRLVGRTLETTFLGEGSEHVLDVNGQRVKVVSTPPLFDPPPELAVEFNPEDAIVLPG
jgi:hypothetical protein